jgi:hypothetical protein
MSVISNAVKYSRFALGIRGFLRGTISLEESKQAIAAALRNREKNFLDLVKEAIYQNPKSPYLKLLELVGCEYGDMESLVNKEGIEATMHKLLAEGVYLSWEEFKGKTDVIRGGRHFQFNESDFDNPILPVSIEGSTGGSRSRGTSIMLNFERFYFLAAYNTVTFEAHGVLGSPALVWQPILPSVAGLAIVFRLIKMGNPPVRWFSPVATRKIRPALAKRLGTYYAVYASRFFGAAFPKPEYVSLEQADEIAYCTAELLKKGRGCIIYTTPSAAVKVCQAAEASRLDLTGTTFVAAGEPLTEAKVKEIRAAGAKAINMYAMTDMTLVCYSCADPAAAHDDIHLCTNSHAVIQRRRETPFGGAPVDAFLFTSLMLDTAKIQLNVESGDYGVIETRQCGCKLGELGLNDHLCNIRSFDKLTGEGMSFVGTDILRIIEEVLPAKFGGASTDYQVVEEEDERGHTRLNIFASPEVGEIDESKLVKTVLAELSKGNDTQRMMADMWSQAEMLQVKRQRPIITAAGKLLPLHIQKVKTK